MTERSSNSSVTALASERASAGRLLKRQLGVSASYPERHQNQLGADAADDAIYLQDPLAPEFVEEELTPRQMISVRRFT